MEISSVTREWGSFLAQNKIDKETTLYICIFDIHFKIRTRQRNSYSMEYFHYLDIVSKQNILVYITE